MADPSEREATLPTGEVTVLESTTRPRTGGQFAVGDRIGGRYLVEGLLGAGGFGEVYRAVDEQRDGAVVALKLQRLLGSDARALESLESEFQLLASLGHPNLARVFDFGHLGSDVAYFTQELVRGTPLIDTELRPDDPAAIPIWSELCRALEYLHSRGILHRDVKPSNVIVDLETRHVTLLDFGIASAFGAFDSDRVVGTPAYMAPEAIAGGPVDARSDLYSLGITLYRQAAGRLPFQGTAAEILTAHLTETAPPLVASEPVVRVIERLIEKEPGVRYASALEALGALAAANGVAALPESSESLASYVLSARFVGQDAVLARLNEHVATESPGRALLVVGEGGSGKSRLLREAKQRAQLARKTWLGLAIKRTQADKAVLHGIARAVLNDDVIASLDEDDRRELARALPELRRPRERLGIAVDPERAKSARIDALARAIRRRFERAPGALVVEDLHWAPRDVLGLLERLRDAVERERARAVLVLAARPGEMADALEGALRAERLSCDLLPLAASSRLVESMFGTPDLLAGTKLGAALSGGAHTAQWVQESLRSALESGAIARRGGAWSVTADVPALPLAEVLEARLSRLSSDARRLALALAVLGGEAPGPDVASTAGRAWAVASLALRELVRSGVAEDRHDARGIAIYAMHDRYRDVVLEASPETVRRAAHRRAARLAKASARGDWRALLDAADHFTSAGDRAAAIAAGREGARLAELSGRPDQAALALQTAIGWQRELGDVSISELTRWFDLALLAGLTESVDRSLEELERASSGAEPRARVEVVLRRARLAVRRGEPMLARALCEDALAGARELAAEELEAELFLLLAQIDEDYGSIERALEEFERAAKIAERCRASAVEARAWLGASLAAVRLANTGRAQHFAERALEAAGGAGDPVLRAEALRHLGNSLRERGDASGALRVYRRAVRAAREGGSPESEAKALNNLGTVCQWVGLVPEALAALERSLLLKERLGLHASAVLTKNNLGALHLAIGRHDEARRELEAIVEEGRESAPVVVALGYSNWGDLCTIEQDFERALDLYRAAHAMNRERDLAGQQSHALSGMVRVLLMRNAPGDADEAAELLVGLERLTEQGDLAETHRRYHTSRAMHFDRIGEPSRALAHARRARTSREDPSAQFSDVFGTVLEARWIEALMLARTGRTVAAARAAQRTASILSRLSRHVGNEREQRVFLEASPLHRAIRAVRLDTPPGWSWLPRESA